MKNAVIVGYVRTPFTPAKKGSLAKVRPDDMAAAVVKGLIEKTGMKPEDVEDLIVGTAFPEGEQGMNIGRMVSLLSDELPIKVAGKQTNRFCASSMEGITEAAGDIATGGGEAFIVVGVESMSRIPMGGHSFRPNKKLYEKLPASYMSMGETAENVAEKYGITREEMDKFAEESHRRSAAAEKKQLFRENIIDITTPDGKVVSHDECIRPDTTAEGISKLKPAFKQDGSVTAATSSPLTDGAVAVLVTSEDYARENGLPILARVKSHAVTGLEPEIMGMGPVESTRKALKRAGIEMDDVDVVEMNEAFASQSIASQRELGIPDEKLNKHGGAISLGHPLGASGARITARAAKILHDEGGKYAVATMCVGGGQGKAVVLERVEDNDNRKKRAPRRKTQPKMG